MGSGNFRLCNPLATKTLFFTIGDEAEVQSVCVQQRRIVIAVSLLMAGEGVVSLIAYFETSQCTFIKFAVGD